MNMRIQIPNLLHRHHVSGSNVMDPCEEDIGLTSVELKRCARLFDEYNRTDCAMFFVELLVTPRSDRAEKIMFSSEEFWKQIQSGALTGRLPGMFELDQFRADCQELSGYLSRLSGIAKQAPEPYCGEVNRWLRNYSS